MKEKNSLAHTSWNYKYNIVFHEVLAEGKKQETAAYSDGVQFPVKVTLPSLESSISDNTIKDNSKNDNHIRGMAVFQSKMARFVSHFIGEIGANWGNNYLKITTKKAIKNLEIVEISRFWLVRDQGLTQLL